MDAEDMALVRATARIAYRGFEKLPEAEQHTVLKCIILAGTEEESRMADRHLFHIGEARAAQLTLRNILEGGRGQGGAA